MVTVYLEQRKIHFLPAVTSHEGCPGHDPGQPPPAEKEVIWRRFLSFVDSASPSLCYHGPDPGLLFRNFASCFKPLEAAGGLVMNPAGQLLFIHRKNHWDLPKGVMEKKESPAGAALREVEEETGIGELRIIEPLRPTFHVYQESGQGWVLKKTHWYLMHSAGTAKPCPQSEEGISRAEWKAADRLEEVLNNTWASVRGLLEDFLNSAPG